MPRFSSPEKQAERASKAVAKQLNDKIASIGTIRNYEQALKNVAAELARNKETLKELTPERAQTYLEQRAEIVGQKTLDMERQAIQAMMQHVTHKLEPGERLEVVKSEHEQILESRAYTREQVQEITQHQAPQNALATEIAYAAGLRAHELLTLERAENRPPDERPALADKFAEREGERYTVTGKGGLTREVLIPKDLAQRLEERRLEEPKLVADRGIHYEQKYDIGAGRNFSQSFSRASENALGWSNGAHGLRHSYAQERMDELQRAGASREHALEVVSQEMGHFRPDITEVYLR
ncbi:MAG: site-specific integrase [Epsilonproteobacteria bacterium]|nr:site-specific integrase [Campylobacterota bacterium]